METQSSPSSFIEYMMKNDNTMKCRNDISTPMGLVREIVASIPDGVFRDGIKVLDPCVGMGNFLVGIQERFETMGITGTMTGIDINYERTSIAKKLLPSANIICGSFLDMATEQYDIIIANPPYAKIMENGKRTSKSHNLFPMFILKGLDMLAEGGALVFLCPTSWMSLSDRNVVAKKLMEFHIVRLDIDSSKKWFAGVGSSFSWFVCVKEKSTTASMITGKFKGKTFNDSIVLKNLDFIPLFCTNMSLRILLKMTSGTKTFSIETSSDLHATTKKSLLSTEKSDAFPYKCVHTKNQTKWSSRPHKFQTGVKVFICLSSTYETWIDECGMTQSVAFVRCENMKQAEKIKDFLDSDAVRFVVSITRYGNFANIRVLQRLTEATLDDDEQKYISDFLY